MRECHLFRQIKPLMLHVTWNTLHKHFSVIYYKNLMAKSESKDPSGLKRSLTCTTSFTPIPGICLGKQTCTPSSKQANCCAINFFYLALFLKGYNIYTAWTVCGHVTCAYPCRHTDTHRYDIYTLISFREDQHLSPVSSRPYTPSSPPPSNSLLSYDRCYVCAVEHKVALLDPSALPSQIWVLEVRPSHLPGPQGNRQAPVCVYQQRLERRAKRKRGMNWVDVILCNTKTKMNLYSFTESHPKISFN